VAYDFVGKDRIPEGAVVESQNEHIRALLIDNNQATVKSVKSFLELSGCDVSTLSSLDKAEESTLLLRLIHPDVVAVSSLLTGTNATAARTLRKALDCPVLVYNGGNAAAAVALKDDILHWTSTKH
jgi:DNA-binding NarL/FixJ family response regulator